MQTKIEMTQKNIFIVCSVLGFGSLQPVFSDDDGLMIFESEANAELEIQECLNEVKQAVQKGDMNEEYERDDYQILSATLEGTKITCSYDGNIYEMDRSEDDWKLISAN